MYKLLARCTTPYGGVNHGVMILSLTYYILKAMTPLGRLLGLKIDWQDEKCNGPMCVGLFDIWGFPCDVTGSSGGSPDIRDLPGYTRSYTRATDQSVDF